MFTIGQKRGVKYSRGIAEATIKVFLSMLILSELSTLALSYKFGTIIINPD
jgi:hypothetical protein